MSLNSVAPKSRTLQIALKNKHVIAYCLYVCIGALSTGFDASLLLPLPQFLKQFGYEYRGEYVVSAGHQAVWNGILVPGCIVGAAITCLISDKLGRRFVFILGSIVFTIGIVQQQLALDWRILASGKFFHFPASQTIIMRVDTGMTMFAIGAPTYISEVTPPGIRGIMLGLVNLAMYIWMFIGSCVLQGVQTVPGNLSFRIPVIVQYIIPLIMFSCTWFIPETPYWLVGKGKADDAKAALRRLHGERHDVDEHLREIESNINQQRMSDVSYTECFKGVNLRRTIIATGVLAGQQVVGLWFVIGYTTYFFTLSGVEKSEAFILTEVMFALQILANIGSWFLIERFGRRILLLAGTTVLLISHLIIGGVGTSHTYNTGPIPKVVVSFMIIFSVFFQFSLGTAGWAVASEVSSPELRAPTQALAVAVNYIAGSLVFLTLPYLINPDQANLGPRVGYIFAALTLITLVFLYYAVPEMKGRTYEELNYMFLHRVPTREFQDYSVRDEMTQMPGGEGLGEAGVVV